MKNTSLNLNNAGMGVVNFKGRTPDVDDLRAAKRFIDCGLSGLNNSLTETIKEKAPSLIREIQGETYITKDTPAMRVKSGLKSFVGMFLDPLDYLGKRFPNSKINNLSIIKAYRKSSKFENEVNALQGLQENGINFVREAISDKKNYPIGKCDDKCREVCSGITERFNKLFNNSMDETKAAYDTKKERFWTRIVSGFTAAIFLGNDFYNKSIQKGKTEEEAKKEQHLKQGQEIRENICEGILQFAVFACFTKLVNKNVMASAVIAAAIGFVSRIVSRLASGMPIFRIKVPERKNQKPVSMKDFIEAAKQGKTKDILDKKEVSPKDNKDKENKENAKNKKEKGAILSFKNIVLLCALSAAGGFSLKYIKDKTKIGQQIAELIQKRQDKFDKETIEDVIAPKEKLKKLKDILEVNSEYKISQNVFDIISNNPDKGAYFIGTDYKKINILGAEVRQKDIRRLKTAPLRFLKELVSYPYKIASKILNFTKTEPKKADAPIDTKLLDPYNIRNIYKKFTEFEAKSGGDDKKLYKEFGEYVRQMRLLSNNNTTSSSCNNSQIAVAAQTLGTITGMWFNMNDEFNSSVRNGSTKKEAEKDARLRGINKFFRMTVQVIISGTLNDIFHKQYNNSLLKAAGIVAASTVLTDAASRVLTGMPAKKMTKEELEEYQKNHKEGIMSGYYKFIDKLAS